MKHIVPKNFDKYKILVTKKIKNKEKKLWSREAFPVEICIHYIENISIETGVFYDLICHFYYS
jgi:hypothetical protein